MRKAAKRDKNEKAIVTALEAVGATVARLNDPNVPDLLVGFRGDNFLIEVKYQYGKLTSGQFGWHENWRGKCATVKTVEQALQVIGAIE